MKKFTKVIAVITCIVMLVVGLPVISYAEGKSANEAFSFIGSSFVASDWTGENNNHTFDSNGVVLEKGNNMNYSTITYKDSYDLAGGFEITYVARGRTRYNNIYDGRYYVGVKIGNITVAMDQYIKPVILVNDSVKVKGNPIIALDSTNPLYDSSKSDGANISNWISESAGEAGIVNPKYVVSYDATDKTIIYSKYHGDEKVFEISYTDSADLINLSNANLSLYHNNSWGFNATYKSIGLAITLTIPDFTDKPNGQCGDSAYWGFDEATGTLYIYGSGATYDYLNVGNTAPWLAYRTQITKVVVGDDITYIGNRSFRGLNYITSAVFGTSVESMGYEVFYVCNRLKKIKLNEGLTKIGALTFYNCTALEEITIPSTVTKIENRAFKGSGLTSVVVPDDVTSTGYEIFMNCANLKGVNFTEGVSMLNPCTFMNCTSLISFNFTDNMCRIRSNAFSGCTALERVSFEDDTMMWGSSNGKEAKIASNAFTDCSSELKLVGTKGGHLETYASLRGFVFVDKASGSFDSIEKYSGTRDPWLWPFAATSIWNMPIGSDAELEYANFQTSKNVGIDDEYHVIVPEGSPTVEVYTPSSWRTRWPGNRKVGTMQIPADFYLADATDKSTPNNCAAFLMPDGRTIRQLEPCCRIETGNARIVGYLHSEDQDIYGEGIKGTHYGSGLSAIGGSIRKGELTSDEPIRHALKLNVYAKQYLYFDKTEQKGYVWPADRHDSYAGGTGDNAYGGTNPNLRMGSLLTIPQNVTAESLGIKTAVGKKLFYALQNYGCYIADDSAWNSYCWSAEDGVREEVQHAYGHSLNGNSGDYFNDCMKLVQSLYIVTNNSPDSIGGGGTPCKPLAPDFK